MFRIGGIYVSTFSRIELDFDKNLMRLLQEEKIDINTFRIISRGTSQIFQHLSLVDQGENGFLQFNKETQQ